MFAFWATAETIQMFILIEPRQTENSRILEPFCCKEGCLENNTAIAAVAAAANDGDRATKKKKIEEKN